MDTGLKVLIVDDQKTMRRIIRNLLTQIGFSKIEEAEDGGQAFEMVKSHKDFGLIISDWNMEPITGLQFLKNLRGSEFDFKNLPFIMITAESKTENVVAAKQAGVSNYIVKPFNAETLRAKIEAIL